MKSFEPEFISRQPITQNLLRTIRTIGEYNVSRPTINRALAELRALGQIRCIKPGRDAVWEKTRSYSD